MITTAVGSKLPESIGPSTDPQCLRRGLLESFSTAYKMAAFRRFGAMYARNFEQRPWLTLAVANGTLGAIADSLAQTLEHVERRRARRTNEEPALILEEAVEQNRNSAQGWDVARTGRFFAFGVMMAPLLDQWNRFIEHRFPLRSAAGSAASTASKAAGAASSLGKVSMAALAKRVVVDQIGFAPFGLVCFVGAMGVMEGRDMASLRAKFDEIYMPALIANWQLWPLVQTINFRFMPLRYRVPFTGGVGIAWQVFLSILNAAKGKELVPTEDKVNTATA